MTNATANMQL